MRGILFALLASSSLTASVQAQESARYNANGIAVEYPKGWKSTAEKKDGIATFTVQNDKGTQAIIQLYPAGTDAKMVGSLLETGFRKAFEGKLVAWSEKKVKQKLVGAEREGNALDFEIAQGVVIHFDIFAFSAGPKKGTYCVVFQHAAFDAAAAKKGFDLIAGSLAEAGAGKEEPKTPAAAPAPGSPTDLPGLIAYWKLDEGKGTEAEDTSANKMKGTLKGGRWADGVKGKALEFSNKGDYLSLGDSPQLNFKAGARFTFAGWFKTPARGGPIVSLRHSKDAGAAIDITVENGRLDGLVREDKHELGKHARVTGASVSDDQWHHFALMRSDKSIELFLDGVSQGTATGRDAGGPITTDLRALGAELLWAKTGTASPYLQGAVDEICVYDRALSAAEVSKLAGPRGQ